MSGNDISFQLEGVVFQYRAACLIMQNDKVLVMREDLNETYDYFPGGRVKAGEDGITAITRELHEELSIKNPALTLRVILENFFKLKGNPYQEMSLYYVLDDPSGLPEHDFSKLDSDGKLHYYFWISLDELASHQIYPTIIKEKIREIMNSDQIIYLKQKDS